MALIQEREGIEPGRQALYCGDKLLSEWSMWPSFPSPMELGVLRNYCLLVEMEEGRTVTLYVDGDDTGRDVKKRLEEKEGIVAEGFELMHGNESLRRQDRLLGQIPNGTTLVLKAKDRRRQGEVFFVQAEGRNTTTLRFFHRLPTVDDVKKMVQDKEAISVDHQELTTLGGEHLAGPECLSARGLGNGSTLALKIRRDTRDHDWHHLDQRMEAIVQTEGGNLTILEFLPWETVDIVKKRIQDQEGIAVDHQELTFAGKRLAGSEPLHAYGIQEDATIRLVVRRPMEVFVQVGDEPAIALEVLPWDTVDRVTGMVRDRARIASDNQQLSFAGKRLVGGPPLSYYGIQPGAKLDLVVRRSMPIRVRTDKGRSLALDVMPWDTVAKLKERIRLREGISTDHQELALAGERLVDGAPVSYYGIQEGSEVELVVRRGP